MMKRILSLVLCFAMLVGVFMMSGCGEAENEQSDTNNVLPMTINMIGITDKRTTPEAIEAVEDAINKISKTRYKTQIELTFVTADEYINLVESRAAEAEYAQLRLAAITKYNTLAQKVANQKQKDMANESNKGLFSKWKQNTKVVEASTLSTGDVYTAEETTVDANGRIETVYPPAASPVDILMIDGKEMYDYLDQKGYLLSVKDKLITEFTKFKQYIYPTYFEQLEQVTGDIKAIPNNNLLAEYTYLVVDKTLADKYDFDVESVETYADLDREGTGFLSKVKANETVTVMNTVPDALGIFTYFDGDIAVGTYYDPIYGYNTTEGTDFSVKNLFEIPQYTDHLVLMDTYRQNGYFDKEADEFAVSVIKGDASIMDIYKDDYYVKVIQKPFVNIESIFNGMLAVSSYTTNDKRALQIIEMINTDPEVKNLLQYGIAYTGKNDDVANYKVNTVVKEDGTQVYSIERLNETYMMDNSLTGNVYMGYPEEGQNISAWEYYKRTNLDSKLSPFSYFYLSDEALDDLLPDMLRRACLTEALDPIGIDYNDYERTTGTVNGDNMRKKLKSHYIVYFMECLDNEGGVEKSPITFATKGEGNEIVQDFISFVLSKEGQKIIKKVGYTPIDNDADSYQANPSLSGKLILGADVGKVVSYFDDALTQIVEAYEAVNKNIKVVMPVKNDKGYYEDYLSEVGVDFDIICLKRALLDYEEEKGYEGTEVCDSYFGVFLDHSSAKYSFTWYENQIINAIIEEKYSDIVSASGLTQMVKNKLASLCGINLSRYPVKDRPASESQVLATAKKNAENYYTNIEYLRIMANEILFEEGEGQKYENLTAVDFEKAVFDYVRTNFEKKNNLTDEGYKKLVQDFMVSVLVYASPTDKTTTYSVTWDEFQLTKEKANVYLNAATKIKDLYMDKLEKVIGKDMIAFYSLSELMDEVYNIMYTEYLEENGFDKNEFQNKVRDIYLKEAGTTAEEFAGYAKTSDEYKNIIKKLRKKYKAILVDTFGKEAYEKGEKGISSDDLLETLDSHFLEEELGIYDKMCELADISYKDFVGAKMDMQNYTMYLNTMKTMYVYTLRTQYTNSEINSWTFEEAEENIFNILYETGFYTDKIAQCIGLTLSEYMLAKSEAVSYQTYLAKLIKELTPALEALGYDVAQFAKQDGDYIESVCEEVVLLKYFGDKISIQEVMKNVSAAYMQGIDSAKDIGAYLEEAKEATASDYFFMAVVNTLEHAWGEQKAEMNQK